MQFNLTKSLVMTAAKGSFIATEQIGSLYRDKVTGKKFAGPLWLGRIAASQEARLAQWEEIKRYGANGKKIGAAAIPRLQNKEDKSLLDAELLPPIKRRTYLA